MAGLTTLLLDDLRELLNLPLGAEEGTELEHQHFCPGLQKFRKTTLTLFLVSFLAFLSLEFLNNSITRFSYGEKPATSRMTDLMKVFLSLDVSAAGWKLA